MAEPNDHDQTAEGQEPAGSEQGATPVKVYPQRYRRKERAGFTTNKGRGQTKARRRMAKTSRRKNRKG